MRKTTRQITPTTALSLSPSATNGTAPRKPPICGIGLQIATHTASNGASGTPSASDAIEHDDAGERGHEQRARDVAADDVVDEAPELVGVGSSPVRARAAGPCARCRSPSSTSVIASSSAKSVADDAVGDRARRVGDRRRVDVEPLRERRRATPAPSPTRSASRSRGPMIGQRRRAGRRSSGSPC